MKTRIVLGLVLTLFFIPSLIYAQVNGDIDGDRDIDATDAMMLEQYLVGLRSSLPSISVQGTIVVDIPNLPVGARVLEMTLIPAGTFLMGSPPDELGRESNEGPQHQVTLTQDFYLGKYEVTQAQWQTVMGSNPASGYGVGDDYPVYYVSWDDCQTFITNLNQLGQGTFRLPTEAEWEYAYRAGTTTRFYWGDDLSYTDVDDYCWYIGNNSPDGTKEVGQKIPNTFGLFDMSGNLWEWCHDWYGSYSSNSQTDPEGPSSGSTRVERGSRWGSFAQGCRSAARSYDSPGHRGYIGFRLLRSYP